MGVKLPRLRVTTTAGLCCWQITHRLSFMTKRNRATHLEQASRWPQGA